MTMKLRYGLASPYARKARVMIVECGLEDRVELVLTSVWDPNSDIASDNPLGKVPALVGEGGEVLYDSPVICEFLDSQHDGLKLFPPAGGARWRALRRQALADGIMDAALLRRMELARPDGERSTSWAERQKAAVDRSLDALEEEADALGPEVTIGQVAIGCALGYLDFRFAHEDWRQGRPALADWYETFADRPSMRATEPRDKA